MNEYFEKLIIDITDSSGFPLSVYNLEDKNFTTYTNGVKKVINVPTTIAPALQNKDTFISFFAKGDETIVIYFFRLNIDNKKYVLVMKDEKNRVCLNKLISHLATISTAPKEEVEVHVEPQIHEVVKEVIVQDTKLVEELQASIAKINDEITTKNKEFDELKFEFDEMKDLVKVVKKSRDKVMTLVDGIFMPMYSMSTKRVLTHGNKALGDYIQAPNIAKVVGKPCYKMIFNLDQPCEWCKLQDVIDKKENVTTEATIIHNDKNTVIDVYTFPITDSVGNIIDYGEFFVDKTDIVEMTSSLNKFKEQIKSFKKTKISDINEIQDVKKAYHELSANYDMVLDRNTKVTHALETLMGQDSMKEVISLKSEIVEYKNKVNRANDTIKNYQKNIEDQQAKYADLNKRVFTQIERFINVVNSRNGAKPDELKSILAFIVKEVDIAKKYLATEDAKKKEKAQQEVVEKAEVTPAESVENTEQVENADLSSEISATLNKFTD